jgi:hypothetical protein
MTIKGKRNGARKSDSYDEEFDLVQNNGRVTLPIGAGTVRLTKKQLRALLFLASSVFLAFLVGRK